MTVTLGLEVNRQLTASFIATCPVEVTLVPRAQTSDGTGGVVLTSGESKSPQLVAILESGDSGYRTPVASDNGKSLSFDFLMLGLHDADFAENDVFTYQEREYKIVTLMPDNGYEKRALVMRHGW